MMTITVAVSAKMTMVTAADDNNCDGGGSSVKNDNGDSS